MQSYCLQYSRNVVLKANHNYIIKDQIHITGKLFTIFKKCCVESKSQHVAEDTRPGQFYCLQYSRNVVLKANHNWKRWSIMTNVVLFTIFKKCCVESKSQLAAAMELHCNNTVYNIQEMLC